MLCCNLLLNKNEKLTRSTIFLPRKENIYKSFLGLGGKKHMFITLFNLYRLSDRAARGGSQTSCLCGCDPLEVKLALLG